MRTTSGYCCLGIACEVAKENGLYLEVDMASNMVYTYNGCMSTLPLDVTEWYEFNGNDPVFSLPFHEPDVSKPDGSQVSASELNDTCGFTFSQIADFFNWELGE